MYYVYLLQSRKTRKFYVGFTENLKRRFDEHNTGNVQTTKNGIPYDMVYFEGFRSKTDALKRERKFKHHGQGMRRLKERLTGSIEN
jgi:putative endonuclease